MAVCYLGLGSNLGNRRQNIEEAIHRINLIGQTKVLKRCAFMQTSPVGGPANQLRFLNTALKINTRLKPLALLKALKKIEKGLGRRSCVRNGPRTIDLDILLYADKRIKSKELIIPHPRMFKRDFVIRPLRELIADEDN